MMDVCDAIKEMEKGKIVKSSAGFGYRIVGSLLEVFQMGVWKPTQIGIVDMAHLEFEIVEEHFDLSKNVEYHPDCRAGIDKYPIYPEEAVKELIKQIKSSISEWDRISDITIKIDGLTGDRFK